MLEIQKYIKQFPSIADANNFLRHKFKIDVRRESLLIDSERVMLRDHVYIYNYTKRSPRNVKLVSEARGLILDSDAEIISMSFEKFMNPFEALQRYQGSNLCWKYAKAEKMEDGTLVVAYKHKGELFFQTRYSANGEENLSQATMSCEHSAKLILSNNLKMYKHFFRPELCYVFELVSPLNKKVNLYDNSKMILLAIFNKIKKHELPAYMVSMFAENTNLGIGRPFSLFVNNIDESNQFLRKLPYGSKGMIVTHSDGTRVKVKSTEYSILESVTRSKKVDVPVKLAELIIKNQYMELKKFFPEYNRLTSLLYDVYSDLFDDLTVLKSTFHNEPVDILERIMKRASKAGYIVTKVRKKEMPDIETGLKTMSGRLLLAIAKDKYESTLNGVLKDLRFST